MQSISSLVGVLLFLVGTAGGFMLEGGNPLFLLRFSLIVAIILAPFGSSILAFGFRDVWDAFSAFRFFFIKPPAQIAFSKTIIVIRFLTLSTYAIGILMFLLGLTNYDASYPLNEIIAICICPLAYPIIISEGLLRPLKSRLECLAERNQEVQQDGRANDPQRGCFKGGQA